MEKERKEGLRLLAMIRAKRALRELFEKDAWLRGQGWGPKIKNNDNPFRKDNIIIAMANELVSVSASKDEKLKIHEFIGTKGTVLGDAIKKNLQEAGLEIED